MSPAAAGRNQPQHRLMTPLLLVARPLRGRDHHGTPDAVGSEMQSITTWLETLQRSMRRSIEQATADIDDEGSGDADHGADETIAERWPQRGGAACCRDCAVECAETSAQKRHDHETPIVQRLGAQPSQLAPALNHGSGRLGRSAMRTCHRGERHPVPAIMAVDQLLPSCLSPRPSHATDPASLRHMRRQIGDLGADNEACGRNAGPADMPRKRIRPRQARLDRPSPVPGARSDVPLPGAQ